MNFKFYNLHITQESKVAWEKGDIKNPRLSLKGVDEQDLSIDELEELMIESIRDSFSDLRNVLSINEFNEAKIIMPALQMCSTDNLDVVDFGIAIINPPDEGEEPSEEYVEEQSLSDWNHPSEMWEEFAEMMSDEDDEDDFDEEYEEEESYEDGDEDDSDDDGFNSESELDIIKKSINGDNS